MAHLTLGFKDLVNSTPSNSLFDLTSLLFDDTYLKSISPERYNFYIKFVSGLSNPEILQKFFYKTKEARDYKDSLNLKVKQLAFLINKLNKNYNTEDKNKIVEDITNTIKNKFKFSDNNISIINDIIEKKGGNIEKPRDMFKYKINKGPQPMKNFLDKVNNISPEIGQKPPLTDVSQLLLDPNKEIEPKSNPELIKKLKNVYDNYKNTLNPDTLKITIADRIIFIVTTFILRYITLMIINWALNTNIINTFNRAFYIYCFIYLIFFIFITMIVNVIVYYPIMELFSNINITTIPNLFYYFYIYTNGSMRLILHICIIILLLFVPYIVNIDKIKINWFEENNKNISYDYDKKNKINESISFFSFIIWILTSIIALKF